MNLKPFEELMPGDVGEDYAGEKATVIAKGTYENLKKYDSTGACDDLEFRNKMVAVVDEEGTELLYVYGWDGFSVKEEHAAASNPTPEPFGHCDTCGAICVEVDGRATCPDDPTHKTAITDTASNPTAGVECPECGAVTLQPCAHSTPASDSGRGDSGAATARPWEVFETGGTLTIIGARVVAGVIAKAGPTGDAEARANAALIVQAVNSFEAMRDALRESALKLHQRHVSGMWQSNDEFPFETCNNRTCKANRAALALADPQQ